MKILRHFSFRTLRRLATGIAFTAISIPGFSQIISTVAGTGGFGNTGDGGQATAAQIGMPGGIAFDASGNMYISDVNNFVIRKVSPAGIISTIAGTGTAAYSGDGGPATAAAITPGALAVDASGNLYFADTYSFSRRVRKINTSGIISTYAGGGSWACPGCGPAGDGGPATAAHFGSVHGIRLDASGNLYITDWTYTTIRKVNASTGIVSTFAGIYTGASTYSGNGGPATAAGIGRPTNLAFDPSGNMYITDNDFGAVRRIDPSGIIHAFAGIPAWGSGGGTPSGDGGPATAARLGPVNNITCDAAGNVYLAALSTGAIRKVSSSGIITRFAGNGSHGYSGDGGPATAAQISSHNWNMLFDASGNMFFADQATGRVRKISPGSPSTITGTLTTCVGGTTTLSYGASGIWSITPTTVATIGSSSGVVTGVAPGTATVTYALTAGGSATAVVTVVATPPSISGPGTICTGMFATYLNAMSGGVWSSSNTTVATIGSTTGFATGVSAGVATLTYSGTSSCYATHTVTIQATPSAITGSSTVCTGGTTTLANTLTGGLWSATGSALTVGSATGIVTGVSTGTSTVSYTLSGCSATKSVTVGPTPTIFTVSGTGTGCSGGTGIPVTLSNSQTGVSYQLYRDGAAVGSPVTGSTGMPILFGGQTVAGTYTVIANPGTSCARTMAGSGVVTITAMPTIYTVTGGGVYCSFGAAPTIGLSNSQTGVTYRLYRGSTPVGGAVTGTGSAISFGTFTIAGTYTAIANPATACSLAMSGMAVVIASSGPLPAIMTVGGGGPFCSGGPGVPVTLPGSSVGYDYVLYRSGVATGISLPGIGSSLHFGLQTIPGVYTVVAVNSITGCANNMRGGANATMYPSPNIYTVTGGGTYCSGGVGFPVGLSGSQVGISYRLYNGSLLSGGPIWGTGGAISFGNRTAAGTYTVRGSTSFCTSTMAGSATIGVIPPPVITGTTFLVAPAATITLSGTPTGGVWSSSIPAVATIGSSSGIVTGVSLGGTVITYTASDCRATRTVYVTRTGRRDPHSGVTYSKAEISVMPNPNYGTFTVEGTLSTADDEQVALELNDMLGKTVYVDMFTATDGKLNKKVELNDMPSGVYLLTVRTPQDKQVFRVVMQ
jgi:hypothetical protein